MPERSIGRIHGWHGNALVLARAYAYILAHGGDGLAEIGRAAVLNARYLKERLRGMYDFPYDGPCMHEFVASSASIKKASGVRALDLAKRLIEEGFHPPTMYFPLIVDEALMVEPTETESPQTVEALARRCWRWRPKRRPTGERRPVPRPARHRWQSGRSGSSPTFAADLVRVTPFHNLARLAAVGADMAPRIMVVDDDPVIRRLVELRFRLADFDAFSTGEPAEAVRLATSERPDAVVLDVMMPGWTGSSLPSGSHRPHLRPPRVMRELATGFEARYLEGIDGFYDPADVGLAGIDVVDDRGRARREPLLSFSFGAALVERAGDAASQALLELAVERSRSLRLRARNTIAIGPTA